MNIKNDKISNENHKNSCKCTEENIIVPKVFDQCRMQDCVELGPVVSAEKCTCIILKPDEDDRFGRVVLPGKPIYIPEIVGKVKVLPDSFETEKIEICSISPSKVKAGYWDIDIKIIFEFKVQLFDNCANILKILCRSSECESLNKCNNIKDYILGRATYVTTVTLFGSKADAPLIASDIFPQLAKPVKNSPHALIELKTYVIDELLKVIHDDCHCDCALDDIYDEPTIFIFITVGLFMLIKLFRLTSLVIESNGYSIADKCSDCPECDCDLFKCMQFPFDEFFPPIKRIGLGE